MDNPNTRDGKVRLWTRQDQRALRVLERRGRFYNHESYLWEKFGDITPFFIDKYRWFVERAKKAVPKPDDVHFQIWCSVAKEYMLRPTETEVVFEIEKKEEDVLYFDGQRWDLVLNHMYIPVDEADDIAYNQHLEKIGIKDYHSLADGKYAALYPEEKKRVLESWERVFEISEWDYFRIQANIWEFYEHEVIRIWTIDDFPPPRTDLPFRIQI